MFHSTGGELVVVAVAAFFAEIGMIALEYIAEHFVVLWYEEIVFCFDVGDYIVGKLACQLEVGLTSIEAGAFYGSWAHIEYSVAAAGFLEFYVYAFDEYLQCCLGGSVDGKEWRRHESCNAYHHSAIKVGVAFEVWVESIYQSQHRDGVHVEGVDDILFRHIFE